MRGLDCEDADAVSPFHSPPNPSGGDSAPPSRPVAIVDLADLKRY
jgi:hypothetical protein